MFENIKMNDTLRGRLEHVVTEFQKFLCVMDAEKYHENAIKIIRMTTCSICQTLHSNLRGEISHEDMVKILKCFINSEKRINKLIVLLSDKETCWYEPIKMAIQIEDIDDINRCISSRPEDVCTVVNRALLTYRSKNKAEELFKLMKSDISDPGIKNQMTILISDIAVFLDPSIIATTNTNSNDYTNKPVIDNCGQHMHGANYTCKEHVETGVFPNPNPQTNQNVPPCNPIPNILPGQQTPGSINEKAFNAMNQINGSGQEAFVSPLKMSERLIGQTVAGQAVNAGDITNKFNSRRDIVKNRLIFPEGTPANIRDSIISRLAAETGYKHFTKLVNETGYVNYNVMYNDINNFRLEALNIEKTTRSELNCIGGNNYNVNTVSINAFDNPIANRMNGIDPQVINYYQNN